MQVKLVRQTDPEPDEQPGLPFDLTLGKVYQVLGIEADDYRLICNDLRSPDDRKIDATSRSKMPQPYLYSPRLFEVVDSSEPSFWVCEYGEGGERYCYPRGWMRVGFFRIITIICPKPMPSSGRYIRDCT